MNSENHFLLQQFINYPSSKIKCLAIHITWKTSSANEKTPTLPFTYVHSWLCRMVTDNTGMYLYSNKPVLKEQTCVPCHISLCPYTITWNFRQFMYCTSLSTIYLCVLNIHNWHLQDQRSSTCFYRQPSPWQK